MSEFDDCVRRRGLVRFEDAGADVVGTELRSASDDVRDAEIMLQNGLWKRVTTTAYYAMFHAARALLLSNGYAEKSHFCLAVGFRHFYGDTETGRGLASGLERARVLREDADYRAQFDEVGARGALAMAHKFVAFSEERLAERE